MTFSLGLDHILHQDQDLELEFDSKAIHEIHLPNHYFEHRASDHDDAIALFERLATLEGIDMDLLFARKAEAVHETMCCAIACLRDHYHKYGPRPLRNKAFRWMQSMMNSWDDFAKYYCTKQARLHYYEEVSRETALAVRRHGKRKAEDGVVTSVEKRQRTRTESSDECSIEFDEPFPCQYAHGLVLA
ncbi:hypothetical protein DFS34DRAFT_104425 [Phlyctochytrium arcticum]|nr:hypothetical protein DFS34DRAFT_104425 [Phlyctochytrium arcticum]